MPTNLYQIILLHDSFFHFTTWVAPYWRSLAAERSSILEVFGQKGLLKEPWIWATSFKSEPELDQITYQTHDGPQARAPTSRRPRRELTNLSAPSLRANQSQRDADALCQ